MWQQWQLSLKSRILYEKRLRQAITPASVLAAALSCTCVYLLVFWVSCFSMRYSDPFLALVIVVAVAAVTSLLTLAAIQRYQAGSPARPLILTALAMWAGLLLGLRDGDRNWVWYTANVFHWQSMVSYVNIDPSADRGQSFMDVGTAYFKEGSEVLRTQAVGFKNGLNYCVAPIVRTPLQGQAAVTAQKTASGLVMPKSGTVDFWAVGTNCCGDKGESFSCDDSLSLTARSGLRVLDDDEQAMYLLAVQEWSATTGLPVQHPLFFKWVKDPIVTAQTLYDQAQDDMTFGVLLSLLVGLVGCAIGAVALQRLRIA